MTAPSSRHIVRWTVLAILVLLAALAVALAIYVHSLLQPQRFTTLLENNLAAAGLRLKMQAPADPTLFPRPAVQLHGFSLTSIGSDVPVLRAEGATIVVPWRALLHGEVAIERIEVEAPRVDLGELASLLARLPHQAGPPRMPTVATGVQMSRGTLTRNGSPLLFDFSIRTGALAPGQAFRLDASARTSGGRRLVASVDTVPSAAHDGVIDFDPLQIHLAAQPATELRVDGRGIWRGGEDLELRLKGTLRHPAPAPAAATTSANAAANAGSAADTATPGTLPTVTDEVAIHVGPASGDKPISVALKLDGDDAHVDMRLQPTQFGTWWNRLLTAKPGQPPVPLPFSGSARLRELDLGWLKATGVRLDAGPDLAPASASSSAAPVAASTASAPASAASGAQ